MELKQLLRKNNNETKHTTKTLYTTVRLSTREHTHKLVRKF